MELELDADESLKRLAGPVLHDVLDVDVYFLGLRRVHRKPSTNASRSMMNRMASVVISGPG
jgi:hypothetical protein